MLDPFAGGSVRGFITALLQHAYYGVDIREEQVSKHVAYALAADRICRSLPTSNSGRHLLQNMKVNR